MKRSGPIKRKLPARHEPTGEKSERPMARATRQATYAGTTAAARPKQPHNVNPHLRNLARGQPCLLQSPVCQPDPETTVACHGAGIANGKGLGYKVSDELSVWGCWCCNDFTDAYKGATAEEKAAVFDAGHARQVLAWQAIAADPLARPWKRQAAQWALKMLEVSL